ncbi:MAG: protein translocase subunit SecF [Rhodospirillaceae bacterium]|jgi:preprotein translocase subunit SecF|nr:protein translocase subunit SecF [Rhodospirillaceae bacterium]MBT6204580.1 protein translocase subunit SecF [Rhodospirillaceae bacterium]MBT6509209.1 protein translocase subunit SecF [Rhodospirillaceae bacterium]MBT7613626.1 protein translocase subunit SecF [Rhodospirillaceae bacterium]MBT7649159.1 protein translocase subunit SecF [Rhodospirillaceae bacterium]
MKLLRLVPAGLRVPFMQFHKVAVSISAALLVASAVLLFTNGLNFGIDFRGGTLIEIETATAPDLGRVRDELNSLGLGDISLQEFGAANDLLIRMALLPGDEAVQQVAVDQVQDALNLMFPGIEYRRVEFVGPQVSGELIEKGTQAVLVAILLMMVYIWLRFEWQFGVGAVIALVHDVGLTIGLFCLFQIDFGLPVVAALLTIVGYSMNDTVVVYDRIRENLRKFKQESMLAIIDRSLSDTLSRTIMTSVTTLLALAALYVFGGEVIAPFVLAMIWGVLVGTYSSLFVAAPLLLYVKPVRNFNDEDDKDETPA